MKEQSINKNRKLIRTRTHNNQNKDFKKEEKKNEQTLSGVQQYIGCVVSEGFV